MLHCEKNRTLIDPLLLGKWLNPTRCESYHFGNIAILAHTWCEFYHFRNILTQPLYFIQSHRVYVDIIIIIINPFNVLYKSMTMVGR
jgi:hypothetical protein